MYDVLEKSGSGEIAMPGSREDGKLGSSKDLKERSTIIKIFS